MPKKLTAAQKPWVVSVNMGYGHERAAWGLRHIAHKQVLAANHYSGIPASDRKIWDGSRKFYEAASRTKSIPFVGEHLFHALVDHMQEIDSFYPRRDLSRPSLQTRQLYYLIRHKDFGRHFIELLAESPRPLVSTFFLPAFMAEEFGYPGDIYSVCTDTDVSRAWAPYDPKRSRIKFFAPTARVVERLKLYGVPEKNILFTGFPLPIEMVDEPSHKFFHKDLKRRLTTLDPDGLFRDRYGRMVEKTLGVRWASTSRRSRPVLTFAIGGAGAQWRIASQVLKSLRVRIEQKHLSLNLVAGTHADLKKRFTTLAKQLGMNRYLGDSVQVQYWKNRDEYFAGFTHLLRSTDVLWTKPSELSFYAGAGIPIIKAPPVGSQEEFNALWLHAVGAGMTQLDPKYADEWLFDLIETGTLAKMAWSGYIEAPTHGTERISKILTGEHCVLVTPPIIV